MATDMGFSHERFGDQLHVESLPWSAGSVIFLRLSWNPKIHTRRRIHRVVQKLTMTRGERDDESTQRGARKATRGRAAHTGLGVL